ncbi:ASCH domain-containing protein [Candidatus Saccharibacteria bacterium]|jgi:ASC-1-like (ASCH) protein|nr:ASCH domain-containing protein [Candidatus Saccharibacteria bacterium]MBP7834921.1 ASCH domain-containing protein [Candidatus Saccharibacteria bacterium]
MNHKTDFKVIGIESNLLDDIIAGRKNIEGRLNKGKHKNYQTGDIILLRRDHRNRNGKLIKGKTIGAKVRVLSVTSYPSFFEMTQNEQYKKIIPTASSALQAAREYNKYYTQTDEQRYGVLAIKISPIIAKEY